MLHCVMIILTLDYIRVDCALKCVKVHARNKGSRVEWSCSNERTS